MSDTQKLSRKARMLRRLTGLGRKEDGNATIEFAILFPIFLMMFLATFEMAFIMTRYMMFDRAMDITVREIRLSENRNFSPQQVKTLLCAQTLILRDHCMEDVKLEMTRLDDNDSWTFAHNDADCRDQPVNVAPIREFTTGDANDVLFIRGCMGMNPLFPSSAFAAFLLRDSTDDKFYMMASSAISVEPVN